MRRGGGVFFLLGAVGWFGGALFGGGLLSVPVHFEVPLGELEGIAVDSKGRVYCGASFYGRVQVYDREGRFLRGWSADASGGAFRIKVDEDDRVHVATARGGLHWIWDREGRLIHKAEDPSQFEAFPASATTDRSGNRYEIRGRSLFPRVVRTDAEGRQCVMIATPWYLWIIQGPFPAWIFFFLGMIVWGVAKGFPDLFLIPEKPPETGTTPEKEK